MKQKKSFVTYSTFKLSSIISATYKAKLTYVIEVLVLTELRVNVLIDVFSTYGSMAQESLTNTEQRFSLRSVYRRIRSFGWQSYRPRLISTLSYRHRGVWRTYRVGSGMKYNCVQWRISIFWWAHDDRRRLHRKQCLANELWYGVQFHV